MTKPVILASSSPYRKSLLKQLGLSFSTANPAIDETARQREDALTLTARLAYEKTKAIAAQNPGCVVIGSDQVADLGGEILTKPHTEPNAIAQLNRCSGQTVRFYTAINVYAEGVHQAETVITDVRFRQLSANQIATYIRKEQPLDCAGSFRCEGLGIALFESISSNDPSALIGLPLMTLNRILMQVGIDTLGDH